jgi:F-type H+-transporting ATPase subunit gamma
MASTRELRRRIKSIGSTAQITKAMQMVAASKMRKAQQAAIDVRPFAQMLYRIQRTATTHCAEFAHPLLEVRDVRKRLIIVVASDKGLCGALNSNLFRLVGRYDPHSTVFIAAGRKAAQFIARTRRQLVAEFPYGDTPRYEESRAIAAVARDLFLKGEVDEVLIAATRFVNTLVQQAVVLEFLPVGDIRGVEIPGAPKPDARPVDSREFVFEPGVEDILEFLLGHYLNVVVHLVLLNAKASEQSARMVSMKSATDNADGLIKELTLTLNKLRQGHITQELLEIAGGQAAG